MKGSLRKFTLVFMVIALLPASFVVYELFTLNKNEKIIRDAYQNQLDAILFSINQYSDDVLSGWASRVQMELTDYRGNDSALDDALTSVINQPRVLRKIYLSDAHGKSLLLDWGDSTSNNTQEDLDTLMMSQAEMVNRLIRYREAGFRKMQALDSIMGLAEMPVLFALDTAGAHGYKIGALMIDEVAFITEILAPKMQAISQGRFNVSISNALTGEVAFSTAQAAAGTSTGNETGNQFQRKDVWVLPGYYLGISLMGNSVEELVQERTTTTLVMLALLVLVLSGGIIFLYRNIRKEIQLSEAKSEFVSNVSHEIRTPLSLIGMFGETLESGRVTSEEKKQEYYQIINKETQRLTRIVNRILDFSRLEANKREFHFEPIEMKDFCREIVHNYVYPLKEQGFEIEFVEGEPFRITGDREAITEAFVNILDNAVKYSLDKKYIKVETSVDSAWGKIAVTDRGIGISKAHLHQIFDQFFRAPSGDIHTTKGSGLGLTLVRKIMLAHGGDVTVSSKPGEGSIFVLQFPTDKTV